MYMLREIHAGTSWILPARSSSLNAATAPCTTWPCSIGALNCGCFGPQKGVSTHLAPPESSHVARAPHTPMVKLTSSLQTSGVR